MNIFYIHEKPEQAVKMMHDKHIVKMILESAQMLCTAHRVLDGTLTTRTKNGKTKKWFRHPVEKYETTLYGAAYINHPSTVWVRQSSENYAWLYSHFLALSLEYSLRYKGRVHSSYAKLFEILQPFPKNIAHKKFTQPPCAMPDRFKVSTDHIFNYRKYYLHEKIKDKKDLFRFLENAKEDIILWQKRKSF